MSVDFKTAPRVKDKSVYEAFHNAQHRCLVCRRGHPNAAHLLGGKDREDVLDGLVPLCGSGAHGCHGAWHGSSYTDVDGAKITPALVKATVARWIRSDRGVSSRAYLVDKLGPFGAEAYVQRLEA